MSISVTLVLAAVLLPAAHAMSGRCAWDTAGRYLTCPDDISDGLPTSPGTANYTRCCTLEVEPYVEAFIVGYNLGTPACCVRRSALHTDASNTPPARPANLQGPALVTSPAPTGTFVQLTGSILFVGQTDDDSSGLSTSTIAGIVVTCIGGLILLIIVVYVIVSATRGGDGKEPPSKAEESDGRHSPYARRKSRANLVCFTSTAV